MVAKGKGLLRTQLSGLSYYCRFAISGNMAFFIKALVTVAAALVCIQKWHTIICCENFLEIHKGVESHPVRSVEGLCHV